MCHIKVIQGSNEKILRFRLGGISDQDRGNLKTIALSTMRKIWSYLRTNWEQYIPERCLKPLTRTETQALGVIDASTKKPVSANCSRALPIDALRWLCTLVLANGQLGQWGSYAIRASHGT